MDTASTQVRIYNEEKCVYEHEVARSNGNDLGTLLRDLRDVQSRVNNFLTTVIQQQDASDIAQNTKDVRSTSSDVELDVEEDEEDEEGERERKEARVSPKKCKLSI